jgi:hypothetical protein
VSVSTSDGTTSGGSADSDAAAARSAAGSGQSGCCADGSVRQVSRPRSSELLAGRVETSVTGSA